MTSEDLITADTLSPTLSARSSTASLVIEENTVRPEASSTFTWAVVVPLVTATTLPGSILRALNFICSFLVDPDSLMDFRIPQAMRVALSDSAKPLSAVCNSSPQFTCFVLQRSGGHHDRFCSAICPPASSTANRRDFGCQRDRPGRPAGPGGLFVV